MRVCACHSPPDVLLDMPPLDLPYPCRITTPDSTPLLPAKRGRQGCGQIDPAVLEEAGLIWRSGSYWYTPGGWPISGGYSIKTGSGLEPFLDSLLYDERRLIGFLWSSSRHLYFDYLLHLQRQAEVLLTVIDRFEIPSRDFLKFWRVVQKLKLTNSRIIDVDRRGSQVSVDRARADQIVYQALEQAMNEAGPVWTFYQQLRPWVIALLKNEGYHEQKWRGSWKYDDSPALDTLQLYCRVCYGIDLPTGEFIEVLTTLFCPNCGQEIIIKGIRELGDPEAKTIILEGNCPKCDYPLADLKS